MNKLYIVLIIIFIICLFNLCNNLYEGHSFEEQDPHIEHGSCDCNPDWEHNYHGTIGNKCHTRPRNPATPTLPPPATSRDPRGGGENRDRIKDFCRRQENMNDCNNASYPRASGIVDWMNSVGTCVWSGGPDTIYHPHSNLDKLECFSGNCSWFHSGSLMSVPPVNISETMKNNITINRDILINSPEFQSFLTRENKGLSDFTGSRSTEVYRGFGLTEQETAIINNLPEEQRENATRNTLYSDSSFSGNYVSILVTGSDDPNDIGKIYKSECYGPDTLNWSKCPREDNIYNQIINNNNVVSLGTSRNNPNHAYGVILYWQ